MNELVSVIVPIYNCEKYILETIETIKKQTYSNMEVIFINDCSLDRSKQLIEKNLQDNMRIIQLEKNSGPAIARNEGIKQAKGRYIAFLDSDDLWESTKIEKQVQFMKEKDCVFSFTSYEFVNSKGESLKHVARVPSTLTYRQALKNTTISTITVMIDLEKISKQDCYMPNVPSEDTATWWKILKKCKVAYGLIEVLSYYRRHDDSLSADKKIAIKRIWNLYRNVEHLSVIYSIYCFISYAINAVTRRIN